MSDPAPPPLLDPVAIQKSIRIWKPVLGIGGMLAAGPVWGLLATIIGMARAFTPMGGNIPEAADSITGGVAMAPCGTAAGLAICPLGVAILVFALRRLSTLRQQLAMLAGS